MLREGPALVRRLETAHLRENHLLGRETEDSRRASSQENFPLTSSPDFSVRSRFGTLEYGLAPGSVWTPPSWTWGTIISSPRRTPSTQATDLIGWYAVHINANDIACLGGKPRWFLATILLPESEVEEGQIQEIFRDIRRACTALEMTLVGGHTEVTSGL